MNYKIGYSSADMDMSFGLFGSSSLAFGEFKNNHFLFFIILWIGENMFVGEDEGKCRVEWNGRMS